MSNMDITTQEIFLRLGTTSMSRSAKADALFRRLRTDGGVATTSSLLKSPRRLSAEDFFPAREGDLIKTEKEKP